MVKGPAVVYCQSEVTLAEDACPPIPFITPPAAAESPATWAPALGSKAKGSPPPAPLPKLQGVAPRPEAKAKPMPAKAWNEVIDAQIQHLLKRKREE
jgi:hypothetical protein